MALDLLIDKHRYENLLYSLSRYKFASRLLRQDDICLDYGCGYGHGSQLLSKCCKKVLAMDSDRKVIEEAASRYLTPKFVIGNLINNCCYKKESFDMIVCMEVIEHMSLLDTERLLSCFNDILSQSGVGIISTPKFRKYDERSKIRKEDHVLEYDYDSFLELLGRIWSRPLIFSQLDEIISTFNPENAWTYIGVIWKK